MTNQTKVTKRPKVTLREVKERVQVYVLIGNIWSVKGWLSRQPSRYETCITYYLLVLNELHIDMPVWLLYISINVFRRGVSPMSKNIGYLKYYF